MDVTDNIIKLKMFTRNLMLKSQFSDNNMSNSCVNIFKKPSSYIPVNNAAIETFEKACVKEI